MEYRNIERVFTVSILGEGGFQFPDPIPLEKKLKDVLEKEVDKKYYLSDKAMSCFMSDGTGKYPRRERFLQNINRKNQDIGNSVTTRAGSRPTDNFVKEPTPLQRKVCDKAIEGGLVMPNDAIEYTYSNARLKEIEQGYIRKQNKSNNQIMSTLKTNPQQIGVCVDEPCRIRKLTPKECYRLMGFDDESFERASKVISSTQLYKTAGNSIVVDVLMAIFGKLLNG